MKYCNIQLRIVSIVPIQGNGGGAVLVNAPKCCRACVIQIPISVIPLMASMTVILLFVISCFAVVSINYLVIDSSKNVEIYECLYVSMEQSEILITEHEKS